MTRTVLTVALLSVTGLGWGVSRAIAPPPPAQEPAASTSPTPQPVEAPNRAVFTSEQEWIVSEIVRVIAGGALAATSGATGATPQVAVQIRPASPADLILSATLDIRVDGQSLPPVVIDRHVWSADAYTGLARALLGPGSPGDSAPPAADRPSPIAALTEPGVEVLLAEEARVSAAMAANPRDPIALEDAALVVASLALREAAGEFQDVRALLSRTTGHLALARALSTSTSSGPSGRLAAIVVDALAGRDDLAIDALERWPRDVAPAGLDAWTTALRLRVTGDWRQLATPHTKTMIERREYARALRERVGPSRLLEYLDTEPDDEADWHRLALHAGWTRASIETGHRFADLGLVGELHEAATVWRHFHQGQPAPEVLIASLNDEGPRAHRAIDWPTWAAALQRHLVAQLFASAWHLGGLGLSREWPEWVGEVQPIYGGLRLFPILRRWTVTTAEAYRAAAAATRELQAWRPELVTPRQSSFIRKPPSFVREADKFPSDVAWFTPHVPTGTAFELEYRTMAAGCKRPVPLPIVERWAAMRAFDFWVRWGIVWLRSTGVPSFDEVTRNLEPIQPYDVRALKHPLDHVRGTPAQYEAAARALCRLEPDSCATLGWRLLSAGREAEAADVYDSYASRARDTVMVSNNLGWLVFYYWDTGRRGRAVELAELVGSVGSAQGLETLGIIRERQGRDDEARAIFERIHRHYENGVALAGYYLRKARHTGDASFAERAATLVGEVFPDGLEMVDSAWLPAPPTDGVAFATFSPRAARTGLQPTDIVVGVDGFRVRSTGQYHVATRSSFDARMTFTVWRDGRNQRVDVDVPQRLFGTGLGNHPLPQPSRTEQ